MQYKEAITRNIQLLTAVQKEAASWDEGPLLVLAGPGSGKTRVLTLRIARLLVESSDDNFRILGLTFTNKAADEIRSRIREIIPGMDKRLYLGTFHSFCAEVLRNHGSHVGIKPDFTIYSENVDLDEIISEVYNSLLIQGKINSLNISKVLPIIQYLKSRLVLPASDLSSYISNIQDRQAIELIYTNYEQKLKELNALDFNSLILKCYELFKNYPFVAKHYRTIYPYICIDEFQDTNQAQYKLVQSLTQGKHGNLFIVADDDQVIYQWNGASATRVEEFRKDYSAQIIQLPENFRCPPEVVQLANNLILYNVNRSKDKKPLLAKKTIQDSFEVNLEYFPNYSTEVGWVSENIQKIYALNRGKTVAVIARNRKLIQPIFENLKDKDIPVIIGQRKNEFESTQLTWLHFILRLAHKRNDKKYLNKVVSNFDLLTQSNVNAEEIMVWSKATDGDLLRGFLISLQNGFQNDSKLLKSLEFDLVEGKDFFRFIEVCFGWLDEQMVTFQNNDEFDVLYYDEKDVWDELQSSLLSRYDREEITLGMFLQELDLLSKEAEPNDSTVQCLTIHASKGKEFDYVYLVGMVEDELPSFQSKKKGDHSIEIEEERRNCFVAITRAKEVLTMTYSENYNGWVKQPSRFLTEMGVLTN